MTIKIIFSKLYSSYFYEYHSIFVNLKIQNMRLTSHIDTNSGSKTAKEAEFQQKSRITALITVITVNYTPKMRSTCLYHGLILPLIRIALTGPYNTLHSTHNDF